MKNKSNKVVIIALSIIALQVTNVIASICNNSLFTGDSLCEILASTISLIAMYITYIQTEKFETINKDLQEEDIRSSNYSTIIFHKYQYLYRHGNGLYSLKLNLFDYKHMPLKYITISKIVLYRSNTRHIRFDEFEKVILLDKPQTSELEFTPEKQEDMIDNKEYYYARIKLNGDLEKLLTTNYYKLEIDMTIKNIFGVETKQTYYLMLTYIKDNISQPPVFEIDHDLGDYCILSKYHSFTNYHEIEYKKNRINRIY